MLLAYCSPSTATPILVKVPVLVSKLKTSPDGYPPP